VLVIDPDPTSALVLAEMLCAWDVRPTSVRSVGEALVVLERAGGAGIRHALVLLDDASIAPEDSGVARLCAMLPTIVLTTPARPGATPGVARVARPVRRALLRAAMERALAGAPAGLAMDARRPLRVLVADDDALSATVLAHLLAREGHAVVQVSDGAAAVAAYEREPFDLLVLDVHMPSCDGLEVAGAIRARERGRHVAIVGLSASSAPGDRERCRGAGMDAFLTKPVDRAQLARTIISLGIATPAAAEREVDVDDVLAHVRGEMSLLRRLIGIFREQSGSLLADGWHAIARADGPALDAAAHALKSVVSHFSRGDAFAHAGAVEALARAGDLARAREGWRVVEHDVRRLDAALDGLGAEPDDGESR